MISRKYRKNEGLVRDFSKAHAPDWAECLTIFFQGQHKKGNKATNDKRPPIVIETIEWQHLKRRFLPFLGNVGNMTWALKSD